MIEYLDFSTLGGILLCVGAYYVFQGKIFIASIFYLIADVCWIYLSYLNGNILGTVLVMIGSIFGLGAFLKMNFGKMRKTLDN